MATEGGSRIAVIAIALSGMFFTVEGAPHSYRPEDLMVKGPARVQIQLAGTETLKSVDPLAANLERNLGFPAA